ncbi:hypothetical protein [Thermoflexus sp.]|uniref:hypothetical protein n=1 Tax=Thermoflexus sp. TaxID=1969742 RepID=UPI002629F3C9|nr:hypothetical protein [Thermoflexus sp.]MCX7690070.1 hypothetical protein [Thermoflexus sp.]
MDRQGTGHRWHGAPETPDALSPATFSPPRPDDRSGQALRFLDWIDVLAPPEATPERAVGGGQMPRRPRRAPCRCSEGKSCGRMMRRGAGGRALAAAP